MAKFVGNSGIEGGRTLGQSLVAKGAELEDRVYEEVVCHAFGQVFVATRVDAVESLVYFGTDMGLLDVGQHFNVDTESASKSGVCWGVGGWIKLTIREICVPLGLLDHCCVGGADGACLCVVPYELFK